MQGGAAAPPKAIELPTPPPQEALDENGEPVHFASGKHLLIDLYRADPATLNDRDGLEKAVTDIISGAGMHLLSVSAHKLEPQGVTVVAGISESHLTIHTWHVTTLSTPLPMHFVFFLVVTSRTLLGCTKPPSSLMRGVRSTTTSGCVPLGSAVSCMSLYADVRTFR